MLHSPTSYISSKLETRNSLKNGHGAFAREPIAVAEVLIVFGGEVITEHQLRGLSATQRHRLLLQVEEGLYLATSHEGPGDWINHSCDPNAGLSGQIAVVALRPIAVNEEVCYDYAMSDGSPYNDFLCECGSINCRRRLSGCDWKIPELQQRYAGFFSPYLQRRITALAMSHRAVGSSE